MTAAQQAAQQTQIEQLMATVAALTAAATAEAPKDVTASTTAKAKTVKRNLDPLDVPTGQEVNGKSIIMRVIAANAAGPCANGARVVPLIDGRQARSFDRATVAALAACHEDVTAAIDKVDRRALLGSHKPAKASTS